MTLLILTHHPTTQPITHTYTLTQKHIKHTKITLLVCIILPAVLTEHMYLSPKSNLLRCFSLRFSLENMILLHRLQSDNTHMQQKTNSWSAVPLDHLHSETIYSSFPALQCSDEKVASYREIFHLH